MLELSIQARKYMNSSSIQQRSIGHLLLLGLIAWSLEMIPAKSIKSFIWPKIWDRLGSLWKSMSMILLGLIPRQLKRLLIRDCQRNEFSLLMIPLLLVTKTRIRRHGLLRLISTTVMISSKARKLLSTMETVSSKLNTTCLSQELLSMTQLRSMSLLLYKAILILRKRSCLKKQCSIHDLSQ